MSIRVRLSFDELVPGYSKKTWFLFDPASCRLVADLEHLIQRKFDFPKNSSVNLYHEGFLLPAQEKIALVRDGDIIRVELTYVYKGKGKANWSEHDDLVSKYKPLKKQRLNGKFFEKYFSKNGNFTRKRTLPSSSSSSESSTYHKKKIHGLNNNHAIKRKQSKTNIRGHNKGLPSGKNSYKKATALRNKMLPSSESSTSSSESSTSSSNTKKGPLSFPSTSSTSSSSSESSSDDNLNKNMNSDKVNDSFSSSSSSMLSSSTSSSSGDSSDDVQMKDQISKTNDKDLNKNAKTKAKIDLETTKSSTKMQNKKAENLFKKLNQSKKGLNSKEKERDEGENSKNKIIVSSSSKKQNENTRNQPKTSSQSKIDGLNSRENEKTMDKNTKSKTVISSSNSYSSYQSNIAQEVSGNTHLINPRADNKSKRTHILPQNANNSHIRFDSDDENQDISANKENTDSSTTRNQDENSYDTFGNIQDCEMSAYVGVLSMNNGGVDGNGNIYKGMDSSVGHAVATKRTVMDYSMLPSLCGPPRVGDRIAYKVLELSASYTPEMSQYKEGTVLEYNPVTNEVALELTEDSLAKPLGDGNISTKFELIYQDEDAEENNEEKPPVIVDRKVSVSWTSMVDPRMISS